MKKMKKLLPIILFFFALGLTACGAGAAPAVVDSVPSEFSGRVNPLGSESAAAGAEIFKNNCAACHGDQGHGDGPAGLALDPKPKDLPILAATVGDDYLFWRVSVGKLGTSMVGWQGILTDEQIWQVVTFIRSLQ